MKSLKLILIVLVILLSQSISSPLPAKADEVVYAYLKTDVVLYQKTATPQNGTSFIPITTLPKTYFVALLADPKDALEGHIEVSYLDITGYVLLSQIEIVDYEPVYKYAEPKAILYFDGKTITLRQKPDHTATHAVPPPEIPSGTTVLYYGTTEGSAMFTQTGTLWYYVRYNSNSTDHYGYIYSVQASQIETISSNIIEKVVKPKPNDPSGKQTDLNLNLNPTSRTVLIICLCIPAVLIMLVLFQKPKPKMRTPRD